jgi:hypothetical protein
MKLRLLLFFLLLSTELFSFTFSVTSLADTGTGTLREAVQLAMDGDTIDFDTTGTITLFSGPITINKDLFIQSTGAANITLSGNSADRIFEITAGKFHASHITFENGVKVGSGGAVYISSTDTVIFEMCNFNYCSATEYGGAIYNDGRHLLIFACSFMSNNANNNGGALLINDGHVLISHSTFHGNTAQVSGGGICISGGQCSLINSTVSGNSALSEGGGILGSFDATFCTFTENTALYGGGTKTSGSTLRNCIIYNNVAGLNGPDLDGNIISYGNNLIGDLSGSGGFTADDLSGINPWLDTLGYYGGYTQTHALLLNSPCIDAGSCIPSIRIDQRKISRTGIPDIGAYEYGGTPFGIHYKSEQMCTGASIQFGVMRIDTAGTYTQTFIDATGCDSTVELDVSYLTVYQIEVRDSICAGGNYYFGSQTISTPGIYSASFVSLTGCDSIVELELSLNIPDTGVIQNGTRLEAAEGMNSYQWFNCNLLQPLPMDTSRIFNASANGSYAVILNRAGCVDTSACYDMTTVNLEDIRKKSGVILYPSITANHSGILFHESKAVAEISVMDSKGNILQKSLHHGKQRVSIELNGLPDGVYFISVKTESNHTFHKVIKIS